MKSIILGLMISFVTTVSASDFFGGKLVDKKTSEAIALKCTLAGYVGCEEAVFVLDDKVINERMIVPMTNLDGDYQDRGGLFAEITILASTSRVLIPYARYLINMRKITKKLRKAFKLMMDPSLSAEKVKMSHKNFLEVIKAIEAY